MMIAMLILTIFYQCGGSLRESWLNYDQDALMDKWLEYADLYDQKLSKFRAPNKSVVFLEIGIQSGGTMIAWNQWFQEAKVDFTYVGVDINPLCKQLDLRSDDKIFVEIGSQENENFLNEICLRYGPFDIISDDGGHTAAQMMISLRTLFPCLKNEGVYVIEDTHTIAMGDETSYYEELTIAQHIGSIYEEMHNYWIPIVSPDKSDQQQQQHMPTNNNNQMFVNAIKAITLEDSMIVIDKQVNMPHLRRITKGTRIIPNDPYAHVIVDLISQDAATGNSELPLGSTSQPAQSDSQTSQHGNIIATVEFAPFVGINNQEIQVESLREEAVDFCTKYDLQLTNCADYFVTAAINNVF